MPGFAFLDELGHGCPGVEVFDFLVAEGCVGDGPVHVVKVKVVNLEIREGGVDAFLDVLAAMTGAMLVPFAPNAVEENKRHTDHSRACS